jgi:hypothetical protein
MSCCGSLFVNLGGGGGGTVNTGVLQIAGGVPLDATLRFVEDQAGTDSILKLSTTKASFTPTGASELTIQADTTLTDYTALYFGAGYKIMSKSGGSIFLNFDSGIVFANGLSGGGGINTSGFYIGSGTVTQNGALTVKSAGANIASYRNSSNVEVSTITGAGNITGLDFLSANLTAGSLTTARVFRVGDKGTITTLNDLGLNAQIAVEHNGNVYYIPCSTSLIT